MSNYRLRKDNQRLRKKLSAARIRHRRQLRLETAVIRGSCAAAIEKWQYAFASLEYDMMERGERMPVRWDQASMPYDIPRPAFAALDGRIEQLAYSMHVGPELQALGREYVLSRVREEMAWKLAKHILEKEIATIAESKAMPYGGICFSTRLLIVKLATPGGAEIDRAWRRDYRVLTPSKSIP